MQPAVFLWAVPRSISTAVFRAMETKSKIKVFLEPFARAYYFGEERNSNRYQHLPPQASSTFLDVKQLLESAVNSDVPVFSKDMAYYLQHKTPKEILELLPKGYKHSFLFRDPYYSIKSLYKMSINEQLTGWEYFDKQECGFKELWQLYEIVRDNLDPNPIVIDADDLLSNPEGYLREYCNKLEMEYEECMLEWRSPEQSLAFDHDWSPWFEGALGATTFHKPLRKYVVGNKTSDRLKRTRSYSVELPEKVLKCVDKNMKYFSLFQNVKLRL